MSIVADNAASVFAAIERIAATSSKTEKENLIRQAGTTSPLFMRVLRAAYDPFLNYGMRKVPERNPGAARASSTLDEPVWWEMLDDLASRKLSGHAAWDAMQRAIHALDDASRELLIRIVRKDLRAGFSDSTINRVFKGTLAEFPYMRCSLPDKSDMAEWNWDEGIISQEKADGMFTNVNVDEQGNIWLTTRQGSPIPLDSLEGLAIAIEVTLKPGTQSHGELTVYRDGVLLAREVGNGMLNSVIGGGTLEAGCYARLDLWDQIPLAAVQPKGKYPMPYKKRLHALVGQLNAPIAQHPDVKKQLGLVPTRIVRSKAEAYTHYRDLLKAGKEGTICKHPNAIWRDGTSKQQVKLKLEVDIDLQVVQVLPGTPGTRNEGRPGSLLCETSCGNLQVSVAIKNEAMRDRIDSDWDTWVGQIMVVRANSIMVPSDSSEAHSLFLPRFVEDHPRSDKAVADNLDTVKAIFRNAVDAA